MPAFKDHFSSDSDSYKQYRPTYPTELFSWLAKQCDNRNNVWDCGTGSGQAAIEHSKHFQQVLATDASEAQISQAEAQSNITYRVSPAETLNVPGYNSDSFDLITVAQAIHWFDLPEFFNTVERVLKPGGHLAVWGYQFINTGTEIDHLIKDFHSNILGPYWPPERKLLNDGYTEITFPYPRLATDSFSMQATWSFSQLIGYLNTWSAVKKYEEVNGTSPLSAIHAELKKCWGGAHSTRTVYWPLTIYLGKKPGHQ
ncbi:MAG: SAM-dependent methyltransferase [Moraxellaceae bacterium]|nr:MAG: SAM-dependent methyltransferase [Moraxellaceae bacterium]